MEKGKRTRLILWILAAAWFLFLYSFLPVSAASYNFLVKKTALGLWFKRLPYFDIQIHLIEYAVPGFIVYRALGSGMKRPHAFLLTVACVFFAGWGEEYLQQFVPLRAYQWTDVLWNAAGGFGGALLGVIYTRLFDDR